MTVALSYSFVNQSSPKHVFGMQVAIVNMLRGFLRHTPQETLPFFVRSAQSQAEVETIAATMGIDPARLVFHHEPYTPETLALYDTVFRVDPMAGDLLACRENVKGQGFSFCALAHAIAGIEGGRVLERYILHPSRMGDAIICPSRAIRSAIRSFWDVYQDHLRMRFGGAFHCPVDLPVIPLGVDLERFDTIVTPDKRAQTRNLLGLDENDVVVLWVGRLSASVKAHPLAMFRAVECAAQKTKKPLTFLMQGYFAPPEAEREFRALARTFCPHATVRFIPNNHAQFPDGLWSAGDIFLSLIDNMQESFGLTPIEAIAAGLPRVISDWDGYRDCVTHNVDGFLVPTIQPPPDMGALLSQSFLLNDASYADYLGKTALSVAIDYHAAGTHIAALADNPSLRAQIAQNARLRLGHYDWKNIIPAYHDLWDALAKRRQKDNDIPTSLKLC